MKNGDKFDKVTYQRELMRKRRMEEKLAEWDRERYPVKEAWLIAVERALRARKYAEKFPDQIVPSDEVFQDVGWQYENEGLKAVHPKESRVEK